MALRAGASPALGNDGCDRLPAKDSTPQWVPQHEAGHDMMISTVALPACINCPCCHFTMASAYTWVWVIDYLTGVPGGCKQAGGGAATRLSPVAT